MVNEFIQPISSNPDIAGIGIRINFYATLLFMVLTPENEYTVEILDGIYKNSVINGLSLVITAVIQTIEKQMDLYHAIFVMQIIFSLNFFYAYGQRLFYRSNQADVGLKIFNWVQTFTTMVFTVWLLYVCIKGSNIGSQQACNHLVGYNMFFVNIRVTVAWLRVLFIIYLIITACALLFNFGIIVSTHMKQLCVDIYGELPDIITGSGGEGTVRQYVNIKLLPAVYGIVTLELMVHHNRPIIQAGENTWGFGQIIAIILTLGLFIDVVVAICDWRDTKKRERGEAIVRTPRQERRLGKRSEVWCATEGAEDFAYLPLESRRHTVG